MDAGACALARAGPGAGKGEDKRSSWHLLAPSLAEDKYLGELTGR